MSQPLLGFRISRTCTDVGVYLYGITVSVKRLSFHRYVGERNRLLDPVVGLRARQHVERAVMPCKKVCHTPRPESGR